MATRSGSSLRLRSCAATAAALTSLSVLAACGDSAGPEEGVTLDDLQEIEGTISDLEDRVASLEDNAAMGAGGDGVMGDEFWQDPEPLLGREVTVSGEVSDVARTTKSGDAFLLGGDVGDPVPVISATASTGAQDGDVVQVSGTVVQIQRDRFQDIFGVDETELFVDPDGWFGIYDGEYGLSADNVEPLSQ